jgi:tetratricopeptide (TPR) repeat protein
VQLGNAGELVEAEAVFRRVLEMDPGRGDAAHHLGQTLSLLGRPKEALEALIGSRELGFHSAELTDSLAVAHYNLGAAAYNSVPRRYAEAVEHYREVLALQPDDFEMRSRLAVALARAGDIPAAELEAKQALDAGPESPEGHFNLGLVYSTADRDLEALSEYDCAVELQPDFADAIGNKGSALAALGRYAEAESALRAALASRDTFSDLQNLGAVLARLERHKEAVEAFERARAIASHADRFSRFGLAYSLAELGRHAEAEHEYRAAIAEDPSMPALNNLAGMLSLLGRPAEAESFAQGAVAMAPAAWRPRATLGMVLAQLGDVAKQDDPYRRAVQELKASLALAPPAAEEPTEVAVTFVDLAYCESRLGLLQEAALHLADAAAAAPNDSDVFNKATADLRILISALSRQRSLAPKWLPYLVGGASLVLISYGVSLIERDKLGGAAFAGLAVIALIGIMAAFYLPDITKVTLPGGASIEKIAGTVTEPPQLSFRINTPNPLTKHIGDDAPV